MKNSKHLIGYLVAILLTFFCTKTFISDTENPIDPDQHIVKTDDCVVPACTENCESAKAIIPIDAVEKLYQEFENTVSPINDSDQLDDIALENLKQLLKTRGIWFEYNDFKEYLSVIDRNAKDAGIEITGLRFYPSRYNEDDEKYGQMTLFYNPTFKTKNNEGIEGDYAYALERNGNDINPILLETILQPFRKDSPKQTSEVNGAAFFSSFSNREISSQSGNHGQINPPPSKMM